MVRHKPPSRIRYEKRHPTISFRLDKETKERLKNVLEGKSFASLIKEAIGVREREKKSVENEYKKGYNEGYEAGFTRGRRVYGVYGKCAICGESMLVTHPEDKKTLAEFMRAEGWCHYECSESGRRERR